MRYMKYSIIIPVYNCKEYLCECVNSILTQNADCDFEILLVDDGSSDGSGELCDSLSKENDSVKSFHKINGGAASARNYGIEKSTGEYLMFIDGDDTLSQGAMDHFSDAFKKNHCDMIVYGMSFDYYHKGTITYQELLSCQINGVKEKSKIFGSFKRYFEDNTLSSACNKVFRSAIIKENQIRFVEGMTLYEDFNFVLNYLAYSEKIFFIDQPYYHYRIDVDHQHLHNRVSNLEKLQSNLELLLSSMLDLSSQTESDEMLSVGADLYISLLDLNLLYSNESIENKRESILAYCNSNVFAEILERGAQPHPRYKELFSRISSGQINDLQKEYRKRRLKMNARKKIKRIIQKVRK